MKKIINRPEDVVLEMCSGMVHANPDMVWNPKYKIIRKKKLNPEKVTLISGVGSGHEPAHAGYVGKGMLDAAICGDVFASPSQVQVYQGLRETAGEKGTLLIVKNYSGDLMNFSNAAAMAKEEGISVMDSLYTVGRRGVAGTVFVHKIAGAAAEKGRNLSQVCAAAQKAADNVRTIGFAYSSCTVPAAGTPTFEIGDTQMEYGVGIHGEPGRSRENMQTADEMAHRMVAQLLEDLSLEQGEEVALLVNGFGATPLQELYLMNYSVNRELDKRGIPVYREFVGNYMTSIDMEGCSISLLKLDEELKELLDFPSMAPYFRVDGPVEKTVFTPLPKKTEKIEGEMRCEESWRVISKEGMTVENIAAMVYQMCQCILKNEKAFCKLDSYAGDGDFGMSIAKGFREVKKEWELLLEEKFSTVQQFLLACSMIIMENCGGASGPVWGSAFRAAALTAGEKTVLDLDDFAAMVESAVTGIQKTGERSFGRGAVLGDKTLIDALIPCSLALRAAADQKLLWKAALKEGAKKAKEGAEKTKEIVARMGRAGTVGERSLGYPDAGAYALGVIFEEVASFMREEA